MLSPMVVAPEPVTTSTPPLRSRLLPLLMPRNKVLPLASVVVLSNGSWMLPVTATLAWPVICGANRD